MHTENSSNGWFNRQESPETPQEREVRMESSRKFYQFKDAAKAAEKRCDYDAARTFRGLMTDEFFRRRG